MSWIESKGRAAVFLSYIAAWKSVKYYVLSQFKKVCAMIFTNFAIFRVWERIAGGWVVIESWSLCQNVWPSFVSNELKLDQEFSQNSMTSHSRAICSQSQKIVKLEKIMAQTSLNFESTCYLTDVQCMIGKTRPDLSTLSTTFYGLSVSYNPFPKAEMR